MVYREGFEVRSKGWVTTRVSQAHNSGERGAGWGQARRNDNHNMIKLLGKGQHIQNINWPYINAYMSRPCLRFYII